MQGCDPPGGHPGLLVRAGGCKPGLSQSLPFTVRWGGPKPRVPACRACVLDPRGPLPETDVLLPLFDLPRSPGPATPGNWKPITAESVPPSLMLVSGEWHAFPSVIHSSETVCCSQHCFLPQGAGREPSGFPGAARPAVLPKQRRLQLPLPSLGAASPGFPQKRPSRQARWGRAGPS